jgi:hypothetical protein
MSREFQRGRTPDNLSVSVPLFIATCNRTPPFRFTCWVRTDGAYGVALGCVLWIFGRGGRCASGCACEDRCRGRGGEDSLNVVRVYVSGFMS